MMRKSFLLLALTLCSSLFAMRTTFAYYWAPEGAAIWKGGYVGGYAGADLGKHDVQAYGQNVYFYNDPDENVTHHPWGVTAGLTLGYNFCLAPFIPSLEAEFGYLRFSGTTASPFDTTGNTLVVSEGGLYGVVAGRLGYACCRWLVYAKGGYAFFIPELGVQNAPYTGDGLLATERKCRNDGWAGGGGIEYFFVSCLSLKVEYLYMGFPTVKISGLSQLAGQLETRYTWTHQINVQSLKLGVNIKI